LKKEQNERAYIVYALKSEEIFFLHVNLDSPN